MSKIRRRLILSLGAFLGSQKVLAADPWQLLRQDGLVVLLRHGLAPGIGDPSGFNLKDCATQRNLSSVGREQARQIGAEFRRRQVRIARVQSSQWCRCLETARLLGLGAVIPEPSLNSFFSDRAQERSQTERLKQLIIQQRDRPGVLIMVTHQVNITALTGVVPSSGDGLILKADGEGKIQNLSSLIF